MKDLSTCCMWRTPLKTRVETKKSPSKACEIFCKYKKPSRCFVRSFQLYISKLSMECPLGSFYFKPLQKWSSSGVWISKQPIGHNKLHTMMSTICSAAGICGYIPITPCEQPVLPGCTIRESMNNSMERTEGVRSYKGKQEENISNLLHQTQVANHHQIIGSLPQLQLQNCTGLRIGLPHP